MDSKMDLSVKLSDIKKGDGLAHYGTKGMRWGVRKDEDRGKSSSKSSGGITKNKLKEEKLRVKLAKQKAKNDVEIAKINAKTEAKNARKKAPKASELTTKQLKERNERMKLESNYKKYVEESRVKTPSEKALAYLLTKGKTAADQAADRAIRQAMNTTVDALMAEASKSAASNKEKKKGEGQSQPKAPKKTPQNTPKTPPKPSSRVNSVPSKVMRTPVSQLPLQGPERPSYMKPVNQRPMQGPPRPDISITLTKKQRRTYMKDYERLYSNQMKGAKRR